jgi:hypothetical protein
VFPVTARHGTPLWHIELRPDGLWLHRKFAGGAIRIPPYRASSHPHSKAHARLTCAACHARWAPQCYGCHSVYDPDAKQWDQLAGKETAGAWRERRWGVRNDLPPLGVAADGHIAPAIPGMIATFDHPAWHGARFQRRFALLDPHTSGPARSCESCHASSVALGLGQGVLSRDGHGWAFHPTRPALVDGLPADAWTSLDGTVSGGATRIGNRPLDPAEMRRILDAAIPANPATPDRADGAAAAGTAPGS